jgi:hypothetical protein
VDLVTGVDGSTAGVDIISRGGVALEGTLEASSFSGGSSPSRQRTECSSRHAHSALKNRKLKSHAQNTEDTSERFDSTGQNACHVNEHGHDVFSGTPLDASLEVTPATVKCGSSAAEIIL